MTPRLVTYVVTVEVVAAAVAVMTVRPPTDVATLMVGSALTLLLALGSVTVLSGVNTHWSASGFLHLSMSLVLGPAGAAAAAISDSVGAALRFRSGWFRLGFNLAVFFLSDVAAWAVYSAIRGADDTVMTGLLAALCAGAAQFLVNLSLLTGVVRLSVGRMDVAAYLRQSLTVSPYFLGYGIAAYGAVLLVRAAGATGFALMVVPVLLLQGFLLFLATRMAQQEEQRLAHAREREALLQQALDASDAERRRIARDLHDTVVQDLAVIVVGLHRQAGKMRKAPEEAGEIAAAVERAAESASEAMAELRSMLRQIAPIDVTAGGLPEAFEDLVAPLRENGVDVVIEADAELLPAATAEALFRIAQEALRNVARHAQATRVDVSLHREGTVVRLEISDNGRGFTAEEQQRRRREGHLGVGLIADLARGLGGELSIESGTGQGTRVVATLPIASGES